MVTIVNIYFQPKTFEDNMSKATRNTKKLISPGQSMAEMIEDFLRFVVITRKIKNNHTLHDWLIKNDTEGENPKITGMRHLR